MERWEERREVVVGERESEEGTGELSTRGVLKNEKNVKLKKGKKHDETKNQKHGEKQCTKQMRKHFHQQNWTNSKKENTKK